MKPLNFVFSSGEIKTFSLVLRSRGIKHGFSASTAGWILLTDEADAERAETEIKLYILENLPLPEGEVFVERKVEIFSFTASFFLLYFFHLFTRFAGMRTDWLEKGRAGAGEIMSGEWWRAVTALTLHADASHILSNSLFGSIAAYSLFRYTGQGRGWFLLICAGAAGNIMNAAVYHPSHGSIGASTAVFAAVGLIAGMRVFAPFRRHGVKAWIPLAASVGLLGILGVSEKADVIAHVMGFAAGLALGPLAAFRALRIKEKTDYMNSLMGFAALFILCLSWLRALGLF